MPDFNLAGSNFQTLIGYALSIFAILVPILEGLTFIVFFWGLSKFILNAGNKEEVSKGKTYMAWGILALFILLSYKAIIGWASNQFEFGSSVNPKSVLDTSSTNVNLNYNGQ